MPLWSSSLISVPAYRKRQQWLQACGQKQESYWFCSAMEKTLESLSISISSQGTNLSGSTGPFIVGTADWCRSMQLHKVRFQQYFRLERNPFYKGEKVKFICIVASNKGLSHWCSLMQLLQRERLTDWFKHLWVCVAQQSSATVSLLIVKMSVHLLQKQCYVAFFI